MIQSLKSLSLATFTILLCSPLGFADVTVSGVTYEMNDKGEYEPLGGVTIQAYRNGVAIMAKPVTSNDKTGKFSFTVKEGEPFDVLFHGEKHIPEVTSIAAIPNGKNVIHIALYKPVQYEKTAKAKQVSVKQKVECVLGQLPNDDPIVRIAKERF